MARFTTDKRLWRYSLADECPDIFCFSTTRHGGYSQGEYATFNVNSYCGDKPEHVCQNHELLRSLLPVPCELIIPHQVHGTEVRVIDRTFISKSPTEKKDWLEGVDALISDMPRFCLCMSTADCIPVLCYDERHRAIAAIHAGWRGTAAHIVGKTLETMQKVYGTTSKDVRACIGPGISMEAFEVGDEVYEAFRLAGFTMPEIATRKEKWHIDLWEANRQELMAFGIQPASIETCGICTWKENQDFFSARRQGIASGRILTGIVCLGNEDADSQE